MSAQVVSLADYRAARLIRRRRDRLVSDWLRSLSRIGLRINPLQGRVA